MGMMTCRICGMWWPVGEPKTCQCPDEMIVTAPRPNGVLPDLKPEQNVESNHHEGCSCSWCHVPPGANAKLVNIGIPPGEEP